MACPEVLTGQRFVAQAIAHIDCQAQSIGTFGYGALADPNSTVAIALTGLLTLFVALFGLRLMISEPIGGRDLVGDVLRVGIVLTLATTWPAWRTIGYELVLQGPAEIAETMGSSANLPGAQGSLIGRLQAADDGIVLLTVYGTGRTTGGVNRSDTIGDSFRGVALTDQEGLANGRIAFLAGVLGPMAIVRLGAGLLLALAPLMAGLLLFAGTRDLFFGWLRALGTVALGALALTITLRVQLAVLEPWLADALAQRAGQVLTPSMPTELVVITISFALVSFGLLALIGRIFFFGGMSLPKVFTRPGPSFQTEGLAAYRVAAAGSDGSAPSRAFQVSAAVAQSMRREERGSEPGRLFDQSSAARERGPAVQAAGRTIAEPLGSAFRASEARQFRRVSAASDKRDRKA